MTCKLGSLCRRGHAHEGTGQSLRDVRGACVACRRHISADSERKAKRRASRVITEADRAWQQANREKLCGYARRWQKANPDKKRAMQRTNRARRKANDPGFVVEYRLRNRFARALRSYARGKEMPSSAYGVHYQAIADHIGPCPGSLDDWHIDHIRPLCSFDLTDPAQVREAFAPENHRWLPRADNLAKIQQDKANSIRRRGQRSSPST